MVWLKGFLTVSQTLFLGHLTIYASFLMFSVIAGGVHLHERYKNREKYEKSKKSYPPISILVPAYNEEVTIISSIQSLLKLDYPVYEIIVLDDGSKDKTAKLVREYFQLEECHCEIKYRLSCRPYHRISEKWFGSVHLTLIEKENGGKGDVLNLGINAANHDYFLCIDADSILQKDSLKNLVRPMQKWDNVISVGGVVQVAQGVRIVDGQVNNYQLPWSLLPCAQAIEYDCAFLGTRILFDYLQSNLIISGAFGLFHKEYVIAVGGYDTQTLGEDMELVMKLHYFCRNNNISYRICYETSAICWSQAPNSLGDLCQQRRRWFLGLYQCLKKYYKMLSRVKFGVVGYFAYIYYLLFEFLAPFIETFGCFIILLSFFSHQLNTSFLVSLFCLHIVFCSLVTFTSFLQRAYSQDLFITPIDLCKAAGVSIFRYCCLHWILNYVRLTSFIGYKKKKKVWGEIKRTEYTT
ncbi:glycosyltransferase family 2 protein [Streptococcus ruminantium]|uniref:glycosyltransferase family 2 protein n=1 Tax=Streptococcus ruminantium TaxID=1917441 RepID=UPI0013EEFFE3|nr:glycosyltransferase family 2 protein [Streptococcus ruminantium]